MSTTPIRSPHGDANVSLDFRSFIKSESSLEAALLDLESEEPLNHIKIPEKYLDTDPASRANANAHSWISSLTVDRLVVAVDATIFWNRPTGCSAATTFSSGGVSSGDADADSRDPVTAAIPEVFWRPRPVSSDPSGPSQHPQSSVHSDQSLKVQISGSAETMTVNHTDLDIVPLSDPSSFTLSINTLTRHSTSSCEGSTVNLNTCVVLEFMSSVSPLATTYSHVVP